MAGNRGRWGLRAAGWLISVLALLNAGVGLGQESEAPLHPLEARVHERINGIRALQGLAPLQLDATLTRVARDYSRLMHEQGFFDHQDPAGRSVGDRLREAGIAFEAVGENIAMNRNLSEPVEAVIRGWMMSDGHRANILRNTFTHTGIGIWREGDTYHFTQVFLLPPGDSARHIRSSSSRGTFSVDRSPRVE